LLDLSREKSSTRNKLVSWRIFKNENI
jgi:hypothetical protein